MKDGPFAQKLEQYLQNSEHGEERIKRWKDDLREASWLAGFRLESYGGREGALIEALVAKIWNEIVDRLSVDVVPRAVGLDAKVQDVVRRLRLHEKTAVYVFLLWGMGGIGKSTLARAIYHRCRKDFEEASFVENSGVNKAIQIQDRLRRDLLQDDSDMRGDIAWGKACLQHGLTKKKVLIVLDDMKKDFTSVEEIIDPMRLCPGSRVVVVARDQGVFPHHRDVSDVFKCDRYEVQLMDPQESWELFCLHAFRGPCADPNFEELARQVVEACHGLPLSLEVLGRYLSTAEREVPWKEAITKLGRNQYKDISSRLEISYDALDPEQQEMFQDVACFLNGESEWTAKCLWDGLVCGCETNLQKLKQLCLVKVDERGHLTMHDHLRDLGRDISRRYLTRVWDDEDLKLLLRSKQDVGQIRGLDTSLPCLDASVLAKMRSLRLLFLRGTKLNGRREGLEDLEIRWLRWESCPHATIPKKISSKFLIVLQVKFLRDRLSKFPSCLTELKGLRELGISATFDHSTIPALERLLKVRIRLCAGPGYFSSLKSLEVAQMSRLHFMTKLPSSFSHLKRLRELDISGCSRLKKLPDDFGSLETLQVLKAAGLRSITELPPSFGHLKRLRELDISGCRRLKELPDDFGSLESLEVLKAAGLRSITELPPSFGHLKGLRELDINFCIRMRKLPDSFGSLENLEVLKASCLIAITNLPASFVHLKQLRELDISHCEQLKLPDDFGYLERLEVLNICGLTKPFPPSFVLLEKRLRKLSEDFGSPGKLEVVQAAGRFWLPGKFGRFRATVNLFRMGSALFANLKKRYKLNIICGQELLKEDSVPLIAGLSPS